MNADVSTCVRDLEMAGVLEDLVRQSLRTLLPVTAALAWAWVVVTVFTSAAQTAPAYLVLALSGAGIGLSWNLEKQHLRQAVTVYLVAVLAAVTVIATACHGVGALYLYVLVLPIAAALTNPRTTWACSAVSGLLLVAVGLRDPTIPPGSLPGPVSVLLLTMVTVHLGSRRLFTSLDWMLTMTRQAQKNEMEARERRAEVRRMLKSLEEAYTRLERANEALIFAREAAQKAYRFKAEFVANVSHELRTPLNLIVGFSEMMATAPESYHGVPLPSEYRGDVMAIYRSAQHLAALINDVLDLSQVEAGKLPIHREPVDLGEVIREAVEIVRGLAVAKGLALHIELPEHLPVLSLDRTRIRQVLLNLLSNASRFCDRGSITVRAELAEREVRVSVVDTGRGISPEKIAHAFEAFSQLSGDPTLEGTGLGLALSKNFVEMHGGIMAIDSTPGQGTTVSFTLPLPEQHRPALARPAPPALQGEGPRVLVLHDDERVLSLLRRYVEGFDFMLAKSRQQAAELAAEAPPAAILVDATWAEGTAAADPSLSPLPIITCPLPSLRRLGLLLGAADWLVKPITREELAAALRRLSPPPRKVLVVDDDRHMLRLLGRMLVSIAPDLQVLEASGGWQGLEVARAQQPGLVLLDLLMAEGSGYDFLEAIKVDPALADLPVILMSAHALEGEASAIQGELSLSRGSGLSLTELLQGIEALLATVTQPPAVARASGPIPPGGQPE